MQDPDEGHLISKIQYENERARDDRWQGQKEEETQRQRERGQDRQTRM